MELKSETAKAREKEIYYQELFENSSEGILLTNPDGSIIAANPALCKLLGYTEEEIIAKGRAGLVDLTAVQLHEFINERERTGHVRREIYHLRKDGSRVLCEISSQIFTDSLGQKRTSMFIRDISEKKRLESALHESELAMKAIFESIQISVIFLDPQANIQNFNTPAFEFAKKILGRSFVKNTSFYSYLSVTEKENARSHIEKAINGEITTREMGRPTVDGEGIWFQFQYTPVKDHDERIIGICFTAVDLTERKEAERDLAQSEERFKVLAEASFEGIAIQEDGLIIEINQNYADIFGYTRAELIGKSVLCVTAPEFYSVVQEHVQLNIESPYEIICLKKDGSRINTIIQAKTLPYKGHTRRVAVIRDITQEKKAEVALRETEERFSRAFHIASLPLVISKFDSGIYMDVNDKFLEFSGYTRAEVVGQHFAEIVKFDPEERTKILNLLALNSNIHDFETSLRNKNQEVKDVIISADIFELMGEKCLLTSFFDITIRKHAERNMAEALTLQREAIAQLEQVSKAKSEFVSIISHEFRNPLTGIQGFSEIIRDLDLPIQEIKESANYINETAIRLNRMVIEILELNLMEAGKMILRLEQVDFNLLLQKTVSSAQPASPRHPILLDCAESLPPLLVDQDKIIQVITNLLSNAVKYSPAGGTIKITTQTEKTQLLVIVADQGMGIPPENLETVFELYSRVNSESSHYIQGTGLGLPIVRQIIELHHGKIWVESSLGQGSSFQFILPFAQPEQE